MKKIAIIGAGSWGTALAVALGRSRQPHRLSLWVHGADVRHHAQPRPELLPPPDVALDSDEKKI